MDGSTGGSQNNIRRDNQRNLSDLTGMLDAPERRPMLRSSSSVERERLAESMPTLYEDRNSLKGSSQGLSDSVRTNPELYLNYEFDREGEGSTVELRRRCKPQNEMQYEGGRLAAQSPNNHSSRKSSLMGSYRAKDSFRDNENRGNVTRENENTAEPPPPSLETKCPTWLEPMNRVRLFVGKVVNDYRVQNFILLLISINALMMGVATLPVVKNDPKIQEIFEIIDQVFLIIFTVESSLQLLYFGWTLFKDGFLVFDLLIVVLSWALEGAQVFRAFRIFRAMRLITRIDTLKNLVLALFSVFPKMTAIFMLLLLIIYIFSVMFTNLFKGMYNDDLVEEPYFDSLYYSLFTLFQMMTLDEWAEILIQIQVTHQWAWLPFVVFIILTGFVVVNLIIAVICDAVHVLGNEGKAGMQGYDSDDYPPEGMEALPNEGGALQLPTASNTERRVEELQRQLDEMVYVQEKMRTTIEFLVKQLGENAAKEASRAGSLRDMGLKRSSSSDSFLEDKQSHSGTLFIPEKSDNT